MLVDQNSSRLALKKDNRFISFTECWSSSYFQCSPQKSLKQEAMSLSDV